MWPLLLLAAVAALLVFFIYDAKKPEKFPPGPRWLPVIGNYILFKQLYKKFRFSHLVWAELSKRYGPLFGLRLGNDRLVLATGYEIAKEILTREEFDARPDGFFFRFRAFGGRYGLVFVDGQFFVEQKRFCMKHLKSMGLNRSVMEDLINVETTELIEYLSKKQTVRIPEDFEVSILNSLWAMMAGERFKLNDPRPRDLLRQIHTSFRLQDMSGGILNQMPFLRFFFPELTSFNTLKAVLKSLIEFVKELIEEHQKSVSPYENRDLIDSYINEIKKQQGEKTTFTEKQLIILVLDLFLAGAETTASTLGFALLYLIHYPHIQEKLRLEMDAVVGKKKQPFLQHRNSLVYLEAFIMEVQRMSNVSPTTISHRAKEDAEVQGYIIPKDTIVMCNLYSIHMNKEHWGDPENFRPERFIDTKGDLILDDWLIPFGLGKRRCIGEALARTNLYLFLTAILHNFVVTSVPGQPLPPIEFHDGATITPHSFEAVFRPRN